MRTDQVGRALDALLRDEHQRMSGHTLANLERSDLRDEIELAADFGYSSKEVKDYVRRAQQESRPGRGRQIARTVDLVRELKAIHAQVREDMAAIASDVKLWQLVRASKRARALRRAREDVQYQLYCLGTIVADAMTSDLFETSYAIGTSGLGRGDTQ
jgi:hypothetical protein